MSRTKHLNGECQHCGGHIRFPAESIGLASPCPQCGRQTELLLAVPPDEPTVPVKTIVFTAIAVLVLIGGLVAALIAVNRLQHTAEQRSAAAAPANSPGTASASPVSALVQAGFQVSAITLEKAADSSAVYAVGSVRNVTDRRRLGIKLELELLDAAGNQVGATTHAHPALEPKAEWRFRMLMKFPKAASAMIVSLKADS